MSRKLDVLVLLGSVQQSLCDKWGDKNIGRAMCQCLSVFCGSLFLVCCCHGSPDSLEKVFTVFFDFPGELYVGILFVKMFVEEVDFVFVYFCECVVNVT